MPRPIQIAFIGLGCYLAYRAWKATFDFRGKHALITGGSRGLGLVMARQLASQGCHLSICARNCDELIRARADLERFGVRVHASACDVTNRESVRDFVAGARCENGTIDVLINNAGVIQAGPLAEMREEDFERSLRTHFWEPCICAPRCCQK